MSEKVGLGSAERLTEQKCSRLPERVAHPITSGYETSGVHMAECARTGTACVAFVVVMIYTAVHVPEDLVNWKSG